MFTHHCTSCDRTQLVFPSQLRSLANTDHGIEVTFECWCGATQAVFTGSAAQSPAAARQPVAA